MPRPRATMEESTGGTQTTPIAAGTAITDASAENEFTSDDGSRRSRDGDVGVDVEETDVDLDLAHTAVAVGGSTPRRSNAVLDHDMEENATVVGDKLARRRRPRGGGGSISKATHGAHRIALFFEQTDAVLQFLQWDGS